MSNQVIVVDKPIGKTPLEMVTQCKSEHPEYATTVVSYAGRLDPMAHGLLLLLIGEENKNRENYLHLDKTYEVEILFGIETDTYDILGKVVTVEKVEKVEPHVIKTAIKKFIGKREQEYPLYSSKAVKGKPLFWWARNEKLDEIEIPSREIEIYSIALISQRTIQGEDLIQGVTEKIHTVTGNFRQEAILHDWRTKIAADAVFTIVKISVACSSGTYMRSLAQSLGKAVGTTAIAYDIYRTKVGEYTL